MRNDLRPVEAIARLSGRTLARLLDTLITHPVASTRMLVEESRVPHASAGRALALFEEIGLAKEVSGEGRFRYWKLTS